MTDTAKETTEALVERKSSKETGDEPQDEQAKPPAEDEDRPQGLGGWLIAIIIMLVFAHPLFAFFTTYGVLHFAETDNPALLSLDGWATLKIICWVIAAVCALCSITAGFCLYRIRTRRSVKLVVVAIWLIFPLSKLCIMLASIHTLGASDSPFSEMSGDLTGDVIIASLFTFYLMHSKRAKSIYQ
jgi:hypothetical protein